MVKGEGNERPKGPITSHAKTKTAPSSSLFVPNPCPTQARAAHLLCLPFKPVLFHLRNRRYRHPPPPWQLLARRLPQRPSKRFPTRQRRQWLLWSTRFCLPQRIIDLVKPRANDEYCQQIHTLWTPPGLSRKENVLPLPRCTTSCVMVRAATPRTCVARALTQRYHADATQIAEGGNEHNESLIQQGTRGGDRGN
ncbi:hypothetical protein C8F04DRAFT_1306484 [Mycena alexandri]|uniref:Uncharacterized protein n=1 Tax=Mycena alexandri TaxID=1745969 RepID=A0AAD6S9R1_9AGAR|nr:hypothetical protein C8F04DRAFT_1306484 [Mycena alexandri]